MSEPRTPAATVKHRVLEFGRFAAYCARRFLRDDGPNIAASLSYASLLALVPLLALTFAVLSLFDGFGELRASLQDQIFQAMLPEAAQAVSGHLAAFVDNARGMTGAGLLGLAVTAILLLNTINGAFGAIWRASEPRHLAFRVLIYWSILSLGPLLLGASISVSTYAFAAVQWAGIEDYARPLFGLLPFGLSAAGFALLFLVVPNRAVVPHHAVTGALVAAVLFELLKKGFGVFLAHFPTYQAVYGALAAVPIFLVWMYLSWAVLLIGAEIAASLPEWRAGEARRLRRAQGPGARLALALALLGRLRQAARDGRAIKEGQLARDLPATLEELDQVLRALRRRGYVVRSGLRRWVLSRDLSNVTLADLLRTLGLSMAPGEGWPAPVAQVVAGLAEAAGAESEQGRRSLAEILDDSGAAAAEEPAAQITAV